MHKTSRIAFAFAALVSSSLAAAAQEAPDFPACTAADGQRVEYIEGERRSVKEFAAMSTFLGPMMPVIVYNPAWMEAAPQAARMLAAVHECMHHRNDDVRRTVMLQREGRLDFAAKLKMEEDADCAAVREARDKYSYGAAELKEYFDYLRETTAPKIHPVIASREKAAMACLAASGLR